MSGGLDHTEQLKALRALHVEERRRMVIAALDERRTSGEGGFLGARLLRLQRELNAIDEAIADERALHSAEAYRENMRLLGRDVDHQARRVGLAS
jgi:hypothetical protein